MLFFGMIHILWGERTLNGLMWGLFLEFALAHAHTGTSIVSMLFPTTRLSGKIAVASISLFYLIFVGSISLAKGSILSAVLFILLSIKRVTMPIGKVDLFREIFYAFTKVMIFIASGGIGFLIGKVFPADIANAPGQKGAEVIPAWGVCYFAGMYFYEKYFEKKRSLGLMKAKSISKENIAIPS
jgi:hypothetical protein